MRPSLFFATVLISFSTAFANDTLVRFALEKLSRAQFEMNAAQEALTAALEQNENKPKTCRITTALYSYVAAGVNEEVAVSNAKAECKKAGTLSNVCDNAETEVCW